MQYLGGIKKDLAPCRLSVRTQKRGVMSFCWYRISSFTCPCIERHLGSEANQRVNATQGFSWTADSSLVVQGEGQLEISFIQSQPANEGAKRHCQPSEHASSSYPLPCISQQLQQRLTLCLANADFKLSSISYTVHAFCLHSISIMTMLKLSKPADVALQQFQHPFLLYNIEHN